MFGFNQDATVIKKNCRSNCCNWFLNCQKLFLNCLINLLLELSKKILKWKKTVFLTLKCSTIGENYVVNTTAGHLNKSCDCPTKCGRSIIVYLYELLKIKLQILQHYFISEIVLFSLIIIYYIQNTISISLIFKFL